MELTFMNQVCRAANFRPILRETDIQIALEEVITVYNDLIKEDGRGTRIVDEMRLIGVTPPTLRRPIYQVTGKSTAVKLDQSVYNALLEHLTMRETGGLYADITTLRKQSDQHFLPIEATNFNKLVMGGVTYKPSTYSPKDSNVVIRLDRPSADGQDNNFPAANIHAAQIHQVFEHRRQISQTEWRNEQFIVVTRLVHLTPAHRQLDPYRRHGDAGGFLCYDRSVAMVEVIRPEAIICHYARTRFVDLRRLDKPCVHVLPLDRVRDLYLSQSTQHGDNS